MNLRQSQCRKKRLRAAGVARIYFKPAFSITRRWSTSLEGAKLSGARLRRANLSDAHVSKADLRQADLFNADLRRADLRGGVAEEASRVYLILNSTLLLLFPRNETLTKTSPTP